MCVLLQIFEQEMQLGPAAAIEVLQAQLVSCATHAAPAVSMLLPQPCTGLQGVSTAAGCFFSVVRYRFCSKDKY